MIIQTYGARNMSDRSYFYYTPVDQVNSRDPRILDIH